jgi:hypothetical protein
MEMKDVKGTNLMMMNVLWAEMEGWKWMVGMMKGTNMMTMNVLWAEMEGWKWMVGMMKGHF